MLIVAKGGSIMVRNPQQKSQNTILKAGTIIDPRQQTVVTVDGKTFKFQDIGLTAANVQSHVESGYLTPQSRNQTDYDHWRTEISPDGKGELVADPPGKVTPPAISGLSRSGRESAKDASVAAIRTSDASGTRGISVTSTPKIKADEIVMDNSKWNLAPGDLLNKPVDELNAMIRERDETAEPFETAEEAAAFLSKDHVYAVARVSEK